MGLSCGVGHRTPCSTRRAAHRRVNIELFAPVEYGAGQKATIAIGVDKIAEALRALSDHLIEWRIPEKANSTALRRRGLEGFAREYAA